MPALWNPQANSIFLQALEQPPAEREAFVRQACGTDASLQEQVRSLLSASAQASGFLESPATAVLSAVDTARAAGTEPPRLDFLSPTVRHDAVGRLGHYEILSVVGSGGFGVVLKAFDEQLHRIVAIKALNQSLAASATARKRFVREARAAAAINHENVVHIHAVEPEATAVPYLVMEYVAGTSLDDKLQASGPPGVKEILRIGMQIAGGLAAAHKQGLVHRDVKPANILLENGVERVKITDFGLARTVDDVALTQTNIIAGTPCYMSPEQARGETVDHRSDLFSLGSVLYAMCAGRTPFRADSTMATLRRVCDDTPRAIREVNSDIPEWLVAIIDRLLAKQPADRIQTAAEVSELLGQHLAQLQQPSPPAAQAAPVSPSNIPNPKSKISPRHWALSAVAAFLLLTMGVSLTEATGLTQFAPTLLRIVTGEGTLLVEVDDPEVKVTVEGDGGLVISGAGLHEFRLKPGKYQLRADKDGKPVSLNQELVTITRGGKRTVRVTRENAGQTTALRDNEVMPQTNAPASEVKARQELCAKRLDVPVEITNSVGMRLRLIPPGEFLMGTAEAEVAEVCKRLEAEGEQAFIIDSVRSEHRSRPVVIAEPFYAGTCEVTVGQFKRFVSERDYRTDGERARVGGFGDGPGGWARRPEHQWQSPGGWEPSDDQPVVQVSWNDAREFCAWLGKREGRTYTLPTEAQWEYAARAGTTARYGEGSDLAALDAVGWVRSNRLAARPGPQPVAQKGPNAFGLYDTHGNVWEWCADPFKEGDRRRAIRGGTWYLSADHARIGSRGAHEPDAAPDAGTGFRVILVGDLKSSRSADPALPFVVQGGQDVVERSFVTLAEAVQNSSDSDTIEIRGNGPFVTEPIKLPSRRTIRAGQGFRPVITADAVPSISGRPRSLLETRTALVLEGLEFRGDADPKPVLAINSLGAALFVANCRFTCCQLPVQTAPTCQLRNSQFGATNTHAVLWWDGSSAVLDNNIFATDVSAPVHLSRIEKVRQMEITRNVFTAGNGGVVRAGPWSTGIIISPLPRGEQAAGTAPLHLSHNIVSGPGGILRVNFSSDSPADSPPMPAELERWPRERFAWHEEQNLYSTGTPLVLLSQGRMWTPVEPTQPVTTLAEWNQFWGQSDTGSMQGAVRFQGGDAVYSAPYTLGPDDFRLRSDSAGYRAGPGGKDLGPDIDLVGPGAAYERWTKTPEYQKWLQDTEHVRAKTPPPPPGSFVVLGGTGVAEQKFDTLAEAAAKSSEGDTIEIRGNGPFATEYIKLSSRRTIRAGQGFRPVLTTSAIKPLFVTDAPLTLEGLEIQGNDFFLANNKIDSHAIQTVSAPLYVANCRFTKFALRVWGAPICQLRNSQFSTARNYAVVCGQGQSLALDNNILATGYTVPFQLDQMDDAQRISITRNAFTAGTFTAWVPGATIAGIHITLIPRREGQTAGPAQVDVSHNIVSPGGILRCSQVSTPDAVPLEGPELERLLRERIAWHDKQNVYPLGTPLLSLCWTPRGGTTRPLAPKQPLKTLAEWDQFWDQSDSGSTQGAVRFQGGDAVYSAPYTLGPDDFRLRSDSAGYRAGPDGKDLGPDIDLVGPGEAYERWKKTLEYQKWLEETGQKK